MSKRELDAENWARLPVTTQLALLRQGLFNHVENCDRRAARIEKLLWLIGAAFIANINWHDLINKLGGFLNG